MAAKDGSNRGGARPGDGRKPKPRAEKIAEGKKAKVILPPDTDETSEMDETPKDKETPDVKAYFDDDQRMGDFYAAEIYREIWKWLCERHCDHIISPQLVEQYSVAMARYVQLERLISDTGFLAKHPTTGAAIGSPLVQMSVNYLRVANLLWQQIFSIVQTNCAEYVSGNPLDDEMERLLRGE